MRLFLVCVFIGLAFNCSAQFFSINPVDSGTFYLKVFRKVAEQTQVISCRKTKLMYFFQPHRTGLSYRDGVIMMSPKNSNQDDYSQLSVDGTEWIVTGMKSNETLPDYIEFLRASRGVSYQISDRNFCVISSD
jgi:hypothetical protein